MTRLAAAAGVLLFVLLLGIIVRVALSPPHPESEPRESEVACGSQASCAPVTESEDSTPPAERIDDGAVTLTNGRSVERMFEMTCAACHLSGVAGAPRRGNLEEWRPRLAKGMAVLYHSALVGVPPGMPAKGLCFDCTPEDLEKMVNYLVASSR